MTSWSRFGGFGGFLAMFFEESFLIFLSVPGGFLEYLLLDPVSQRGLRTPIEICFL